jgi:peptide-methionine (S)-S-oxide reductase
VARATFGAGCFWGVESAFRQIRGVTDVAVGYEGGAFPNPTYKDVCTDRTGHAEVVEVDYDPEQVPYDELLRVFFDIHDPTTLNRQGPDHGSQYRSVIFFHDAAQEAAAKAMKAELDRTGRWPRKVVTQIVAAGDFYRAEEYHQRYFEKHGIASCHIR